MSPGSPTEVLSLDDEPAEKLGDTPGSRPGLAKPDLAKPDLAKLRPAEPELVRRDPPPVWLVAIAGGFALAIWAGPVAVSRAAGLNLGLGILVGGFLAAAALAVNAAAAFLTRLPVAARVGLMIVATGGLLGTFFVGAFLAGWDEQRKPVEDPPLAPSPIEPSPPPIVPPPPPPPPKARTPASHIDQAYWTGMTRLDDGTAAVTALALAPDGSIVIGHADGSTLVWSLDQPTFEPPSPGPKGDGAVRRIQFDAAGQLAYLTCDNGLVVAPLIGAPPVLLKIPGNPVLVLADGNRDRFAAVRGDKLHVRYVPTDLAKKPPPVKGAVKFVSCPPQSEVLPVGVRPEYPVSVPNAAFVAWHPAGKLLWGMTDGTVCAWPTIGGGRPEVVSKEHKGAVRVWAVNGLDFATGDDKGSIGYWENKATKPVTYWNGTAPVTQLAFAGWGRDLAVADADGGLSVWDLGKGTRAFEIKRPVPVAALCFGPSDDLLLLADGKGAEVWWIPELLRTARLPKANPLPGG